MLFCSFRNCFHLLKIKIQYHTFLIIFHYSIISCGAQISFSYSTFNPNTKGIVYDGNATASSPVIQLTLNQNDRGLNQSSGIATYFEAMHLWDKESGSIADFSSNFSFKINSQGLDDYSDGMTFFLAPVGFTMPWKQQGAGLGLVYVNESANLPITQFVAVEFDTHVNPKDPRDPPYDHVGIDINSVTSVKTVRWNNRIPDGVINRAWISYNSSAKNLTVLFTSFLDNISKPSIESLWYEVDLSKCLPEKVIFGFSAATGRLTSEIHTINSWNFSSNIRINTVTSNPPEIAPKVTVSSSPRRKNSEKVVVVGLVVGVLACIVLTGAAFLWFKAKRNQKAVNNMEKDVPMVPYEFENETGPKKYSYETLSTSTKNFAEAEKIGQGGFGGVYKGFLSQLNSYVAVKRISKGSKQGIKEYASEVKIISRVRHRNLVQLIGWCHEEKELLLVYEFMPNGSLDSHLFKDNMFLTWMMRYNIARGLASALLYLHKEWEQCVLHRDVKSSNIMLDSDFNAKLGDFGLARLVDHGKEIETTLLAGTMGYMAPEYVMTGRASKETDVYSFGIVALEIASGRKPINPRGKQGEVLLVEFVWELYGQGKILEAADPKLSADFDEKELTCLLIVGLWCAHPDHKLRPSIRQAIQVLNFEAPLPSIASTMPTLNYSTTTSTYSDSRTGSSRVVSS
ncbi:L-type lectin-domain containing receptor kinase IX.1-like [Apium graveolens]|uniref:L-type lectin-domain containing receptor kinase IX.1-like n=1 Tax=Apium graveolens TaxID=4045 RepID=UPI003D7B7C26